LVHQASWEESLATELAARPDEWKIFGSARRPVTIDGVQPVAADLTSPDSLRSALDRIKLTHVFLSTWMRQATEAENIKVNSALARNLLDALPIGTPLWRDSAGGCRARVGEDSSQTQTHRTETELARSRHRYEQE
jgi:hypothetical protein